MDISYSSSKLEKVLTSDRELKKKYNVQWIPKIKMRLKELEIADSLEELRDGPGHWHPLTGNLAPMWAGEVSGNFRMLISPGTDGVAAEVTAVTVEKIGDYH